MAPDGKVCFGRLQHDILDKQNGPRRTGQAIILKCLRRGVEDVNKYNKSYIHIHGNCSKNAIRQSRELLRTGD